MIGWKEGMIFRLTYEGILLGASRQDTRARHKHEIRRKFHPQLRQLWQATHLKEMPEFTASFPDGMTAPSKRRHFTSVENI
jgi:1,2-phenylacetyl-CoA epoxidase catalytic subunit